MPPLDLPFDPRTITDREIQQLSEDRLDRAGFARQIAKRIVAAGRGPSIVYGLAGPWGGGKTSVVNMVDNVLSEEHKAAWSVVRFTPWAASDVDAMTVEFYNAIAEAMPRTNASGRRAKQMLLAAAPVAVAAGQAALKGILENRLGKGVLGDAAEAARDSLAEQVGDLKADPDPFIKRFDKLSNLITRANRQVLIVVDDIDRLHVDELLGVMKAVRLLGRFDNVHYLLSYDQATVIDVLMASDLTADKPIRAQQYLEKIVQYPFELPPIDPVHLVREFLSAMKAVLAVHGMLSTEDPAGQEQSIASILDSLPDKDYDELTIRFIHRLAGQVDVLLTLVADESGPELDTIDAIIVTILRLKYEPIYRQVPRWRSELISDSHVVGVKKLGTLGAKGTWEVRIKQIMGTNGKGDVDDSHVEQVVRMLGQIFPRVFDRVPPADEIKPFSIQTGEYFRRYFAFGLPVEDIADSRVRQELKALISSGSLPANSTIATMVGDASALNRLRRKVLRNLDVLTATPSEHAAEAAHNLTRVLHPRDLDYGGWARVVYAILENAVRLAGDEAAARAIVNDYGDTFGLSVCATVISDPAGLDSAAHSRMVDASAVVREKIQAACELDLTSDALGADPNASTVLHFVGLLDAQQWDRLRTFAVSQIDQGKSQLHHLAARFVRVREQKFEGWPSRFFVDNYIDDYFVRILPVQEWELATVPEYRSGDVLLKDNSLENRQKLAANLLHQVFKSQAASSAGQDE